MAEKHEPSEGKAPDQTGNSWLDTWMKFMQPAQCNPWATTGTDWLKMQEEFARRFWTPGGGEAFGGLYQKLMDASNMYMGLMKTWADAGPNMAADPEKLKNLMGAWTEGQKEIFSRMFGMPMPDMQAGNAKDWAEAARKSLENVKEFYSKNYHTCSENLQNFARNADNAMRASFDPSKYNDLYGSWLKSYEAALGKFINIPAMGPSRQLLDKIAGSADAFVKYCAASAEFQMVMCSPGKNAAEEISRKAASLLKGEITHEKYREFYEMLIKTFEDRFQQLFKTPAFGEIMKTTLEASLEFRNQHFAVMEELLKSTPIITRKEMDDVYEEMYDLKKRIKEIEKLSQKGHEKK